MTTEASSTRRPVRALFRTAAVLFFGFSAALATSLVGPGASPAAAESSRHRRDAGADAATASASEAGSSANQVASAWSDHAGPLDDRASPSAAASLSVAPPASAAFVPENRGVQVKLRASRWQREERNLFTVRVALGGRTVEERARGATQALEQVIEGSEPTNVHVESQGELAVVFVGERPIIELGREDALAAGDASLNVHAASIASRVRDGLSAEQKLTRLVQTGLRLVLVLLGGLVALYLSRKTRRLTRAAHSWFNEHPDRIPKLRVQSIEVIRAGSLRLLLSASARLVNIVVQLGLAYGWLLLALYIFEPTRGYTERLTDLVLSPISAFMNKVGSSLPVLIVAVASVTALVILIRFVGAYFGSAARGETTIAWVPPDLLGPTSLVVRLALVVLFLIVAVPFITGNEALSRVGLVALISLGFASTPLLASACLGVVVIYSRGLRIGDFASFGAFSGRIQAVTLLEVRLIDHEGSEIRVPHLFRLLAPTRVYGQRRLVSASVTVSSQIPQGPVRKLLLEAAATAGITPKLDLVSFDARGASYRVTIASEFSEAPEELASALTDVLAERKIPLGQPPS